MNRFSALSLFSGSALATVMLLSARDASASWWTRLPAAAACYPSSIGTGGQAAPTLDGVFFLEGNTSGLIGTSLECGFANMNVAQTSATFTTYDSDIGTTSSITVDIWDEGGSGIPASSVTAEACRFSSWTHTCGGTTSNSLISNGGHQGMAISDKSAWTNDSGPGYAYVYISEASNTEAWIAGIYIST